MVNLCTWDTTTKQWLNPRTAGDQVGVPVLMVTVCMRVRMVSSYPRQLSSAAGSASSWELTARHKSAARLPDFCFYLNWRIFKTTNNITDSEHDNLTNYLLISTSEDQCSEECHWRLGSWSCWSLRPGKWQEQWRSSRQTAPASRTLLCSWCMDRMCPHHNDTWSEMNPVETDDD